MCRKNCHCPLCDRWCEIRMQYTIISSLWLVSCFLDLMHIDECYLCGQRCAFIVDSEAVLALPFSWAVVLFSPLSYVVWPHTIAPSHCVKSSVETEKKRKKKPWCPQYFSTQMDTLAVATCHYELIHHAIPSLKRLTVCRSLMMNSRQRHFFSSTTVAKMLAHGGL